MSWAQEYEDVVPKGRWHYTDDLLKSYPYVPLEHRAAMIQNVEKSRTANQIQDKTLVSS